MAKYNNREVTILQYVERGVPQVLIHDINGNMQVKLSELELNATEKKEAEDLHKVNYRTLEKKDQDELNRRYRHDRLVDHKTEVKTPVTNTPVSPVSHNKAKVASGSLATHRPV